jgi:hypothetical protein
MALSRDFWISGPGLQRSSEFRDYTERFAPVHRSAARGPRALRAQALYVGSVTVATGSRKLTRLPMLLTKVLLLMTSCGIGGLEM